MHELSVAADILESVLTFAARQAPAQVVSLRVALGELTRLDAEQLRFCFQSIASGTAAEATVLELETTAAQVECPHCAYLGPPVYWDGALAGVSVATLQCPRCRNAAQATKGHECEIKSVRWVRAAEDVP